MIVWSDRETLAGQRKPANNPPLLIYKKERKICAFICVRCPSGHPSAAVKLAWRRYTRLTSTKRQISWVDDSISSRNSGNLLQSTGYANFPGS